MSSKNQRYCGRWRGKVHLTRPSRFTTPIQTEYFHSGGATTNELHRGCSFLSASPDLCFQPCDQDELLLSMTFLFRSVIICLLVSNEVEEVEGDLRPAEDQVFSPVPIHSFPFQAATPTLARNIPSSTSVLPTKKILVCAFLQNGQVKEVMMAIYEQIVVKAGRSRVPQPSPHCTTHGNSMSDAKTPKLCIL